MSTNELELPDLANGASPPARRQEPDTAVEVDHRDKVAADLKPVFDVPVSVQAVIGRTSIGISDLLNLGPGSVLELDRRVGEAIDIYVNSRLIARGEVVVIDERLGVTMTEIIKNADG